MQLPVPIVLNTPVPLPASPSQIRLAFAVAAINIEPATVARRFPKWVVIPSSLSTGRVGKSPERDADPRPLLRNC
jgi:hypothetical protein